jgi:hypothetical protein
MFPGRQNDTTGIRDPELRSDMTTLNGRITLVQEQRFRVMSEAGQSYLLTLDRDANLQMEELRILLLEGASVIVDYTGQPGLASASARRVRRV